MTVKIALKKKFNKNTAACFYTEYAKSVTCKTIPAAEIMAMGFDETDPHDQYVVVEDKGGSESTFRNSYVDVFISCSSGGATGTPITWSVGTFEPNTAKGPEPQESGSGPFILRDR